MTETRKGHLAPYSRDQAMHRTGLLLLLVVFLSCSFSAMADIGRHEKQAETASSGRVAPWARPTLGRFHTGGWVGGGVSRRARAAGSQEGTWGWDFQGRFGKRIWLGWSLDGRHQGGTGAYGTDGPRIRKHHTAHQPDSDRGPASTPPH